MSDKGVLGRFFDNDVILWFIIFFLLLFWCKECRVGGLFD